VPIVALCDHNPLTLQTDRQTDRHDARSTHAKSIVTFTIKCQLCPTSSQLMCSCPGGLETANPNQSNKDKVDHPWERITECFRTHRPNNGSLKTSLKIVNNITSRAYATMSVSVCLSVCLCDGSALAHYS